MPIEVHCPNPVCARVHVVKNRYAGMRGRCPACNAWMYVPLSGGAMSMPEPAHSQRTEAVDWSAAETAPATSSKRAPVMEQEELDPPFDQKPTRRKRPPGKPSRAVEADESASQTDTPPTKRRRFSGMGALCLLLGSLGMGAVAASPWVATTGGATAKSIDAEWGIYASLVPGGVAGLTFLFFLGGILTRRLGFLTILLLYPSTAFSAAVLFLALYEVLPTMEFSQKLYAATGGATAACLFYLLAALFIHRRWWARLFTFLALGTVVAAAPVYFYRAEVGLGDLIPEIDPKQVLQTMGL